MVWPLASPPTSPSTSRRTCKHATQPTPSTQGLGAHGRGGPPPRRAPPHPCLSPPAKRTEASGPWYRQSTLADPIGPRPRRAWPGRPAARLPLTKFSHPCPAMRTETSGPWGRQSTRAVARNNRPGASMRVVGAAPPPGPRHATPTHAEGRPEPPSIANGHAHRGLGPTGSASGAPQWPAPSARGLGARGRGGRPPGPRPANAPAAREDPPARSLQPRQGSRPCGGSSRGTGSR